MGSYLAIGEFPLRIVPTEDGGEGIRRLLFCVKNKETHGAVCLQNKTCIGTGARLENQALEPLVRA